MRRFEPPGPSRQVGNGARLTRLAASAASQRLLCKDVLGGEILKTDVEGYWHLYNQNDGRRWDLTMSQFEPPIAYDDLPSTREEALSDTSPEQYRLLSQRVFEWQNRSESRIAHVWTRHQSPPHRPKIVAVGSRFLPPRSFRQNSAEGRLDGRNQKEVSGAA